MNPMLDPPKNGNPSMEKTQSIESWQKNRQKFRNGNSTETLTIKHNSANALDNYQLLTEGKLDSLSSVRKPN